VCGPAAGEHLVQPVDGVRYLVYETPVEAGRFLIGRKKNALLKALKHERALICHTRIVLRPGILKELPDEFDLLTPQVLVDGKKGKLPYLDLGFLKLETVSMAGKREQPPIYYNRKNWYEFLKSYYPYIDGGIFCVRRRLALSVPLHNEVAWGEGEDAEWCLRLIHTGNVIEITTAPNAKADTATCKLPNYAKFGHLWIYRFLGRIWRNLRGFIV